MNSESIQSLHYNRIAEKYAAHYGDSWSQQYRRVFINDALMADIDLSGKNVLEAMCGSGETTQYLLNRKAIVTGLDISSQEIDEFKRRWPSCQGICASITNSNLPSGSFDAVVVVAGLHHVHPDISAAIEEIHRILRPGGYFCFMEPHSGSFPDIIRKLWYRADSAFAKNEAAVDIGRLKREFSDHFVVENESFRGNIAYLLVFNSMIFRIPLALKPLYSSWLFKVERILEKVQGKGLSCFATSRWRKI